MKKWFNWLYKKSKGKTLWFIKWTIRWTILLFMGLWLSGCGFKFAVWDKFFSKSFAGNKLIQDIVDSSTSINLDYGIPTLACVSLVFVIGLQNWLSNRKSGKNFNKMIDTMEKEREDNNKLINNLVNKISD